MAINPLRLARQLPGALRRQAASASPAPGAGAAAVAGAPGRSAGVPAGTTTSSTPGPLTPESLERAAAQAALRVGAWQREDPDQRRRRAVRCFLEGVLLQAWGQRLALDPAFPALVEAVHAAMLADPGLARAADALGQQLCDAGAAESGAVGGG